MFINKIKILLPLLLVSSIPMSLRFNSLVTVVGFSFFLFFILKEFKYAVLKDRLFQFCFAFFAILLFGAIRCTDVSSAFADIERNLFLIVFPILVFQFKDLKIDVSKLLYYFSLACFAVVFFGISYALLCYELEKRNQVFQQGHIFFTDIIGIHPTYLSTFFIFIIFYSLEELRQLRMFWREKGNHTVFYFVTLVLSVTILLFLRAQIPLIIFVFCLALYLVIVTRKRAWLITYSLLTLGFITLLLDPSRVLTFFDTYGKNVSTALDNRVVLWKGVMKGIETSPFFGAGTGDEQILINEGYRQIGFSEGIENSFNAHNQYLQFLCRNGIVELVVFLLILIYCFSSALKQPNFVFLIFLISFSLLMLTESSLNVQRGIVFFYFFISAFIYLPYRNPTSGTASSEKK